MTSEVETYLANLPADRRAALEQVRAVINANIPPGYEEGLQYGMPTWFVPKTRLADTYNGQPLAIASLGSQKNYMALYLMSVYGDAALRTWFENAYKQAGKKLDMGKACIRFKTLDALPLDVIAQAISKVPVDTYVAAYEASRAKTAPTAPAIEAPAAKPATAKPAMPAKAEPAAKPPAAKTPAATKLVVKKSAAKPPAAKKPAAKKPAAKKATAKKPAAKKPAAKKPAKRR